MRVLIIALIMLLNFILETTVFQYLRIVGIKPDFTIVLIVSYSILRGPKYGTFIGLFSGIMFDIMYGKVIGIYSLSYMLTGYIVGQLHTSVFKDSYVPAVVFNFFAVLISQHLYYIIAYFTKMSISYSSALLSIMIPLAFYNAIFGGILYRYIFKLDELKFMDTNIY